MLSGHVRQTHERLRGHAFVRIVHDTTTFRFLGDREGLGVTRGDAQGFLGHVALAVAADDTREPLGVLGVRSYIHQDAVAHRGMTPSARVEATRAPIEWMLLTSEAVETGETATAVVDHYRARWLIEEYFKALKTGCAFERRQLTTFDGLVRALALFIPMAWRLLALRQLGRAASSLPVARCLDADQLNLLRKLLDQRRGIAALGGHVSNNGAPGWLVLGRGLTRLLDADVGWRLAREM